MGRRTHLRSRGRGKGRKRPKNWHRGQVEFKAWQRAEVLLFGRVRT